MFKTKIEQINKYLMWHNFKPKRTKILNNLETYS